MIRRVTERDDFAGLARLLNAAFSDVAKEFGLTRTNAPTNNAFITGDELRVQLTDDREFYVFVDNPAIHIAGMIAGAGSDDDPASVREGEIAGKGTDAGAGAGAGAGVGVGNSTGDSAVGSGACFCSLFYHLSKAIGFVAIERSRNTVDTFHIEKLAVMPTCRHLGLGRQLMDFATDRIMRLGG